MIITRTPLRISLGGGGTDLPSFYRTHGPGFLIAATISKYIYIAVHRNFDDDLLLKYSAVERVAAAKEAEHPLLRSCLELTGINAGIEITSMADIPAGTGLGSSGAFTVGVLRALHGYLHDYVTNIELAEEACKVEIEILGEPVGKQDQYISAVGGVSAFTFHGDERVDVEAVHVSRDTRDRLEENLLLFYTGVRRSASVALSDERRPVVRTSSVEDNLKRVRDLGYETKDALEAGDMGTFGSLLSEQWRLKFERAPSAIHHEINEWIGAGLAAGAAGGKLVGAGGGGFLLFYSEHKARLRDAMNDLGLEEIRFALDYQGSSTMVRE